jgi:Transcriptional Coactivator p15 (PC4)
MATVAAIRKNATEELRVSLDEYRGRQLVRLRVFFTADHGTPRPGKAGVALLVEMLHAIQAAILAAEAEALRLGLIEGEG